MGISDVWDWIVDGFDEIKDSVGEFFTGMPEAFTSDSPIFNFWFWLFYGLFMLGIWVLPSAMGLPDYKLYEKLLASIIFFAIDFFMINHFKD